MNFYKSILVTGVIFQALAIGNIHAKSCDSSDGVNLTSPGNAFSGIMPRDQGRLGLCFSYAATDLLRSHIGANSPFNVFDAAVNTDEDVSGGDPGSVMKSLIERGWACTDTYKFQNMFPSSDKNILTELEELSIDMPVFYTMDLTTGEARQRRIAEKAAALNGHGGCELWNGTKAIEKEIDQLYKDIDKLNSKVSNLRGELNTLDWGWVNYLSGSRDNAEIQKDINKVSAQRTQKEKKVESLEKKQENYEKKIQGKNNLDHYS